MLLAFADAQGRLSLSLVSPPSPLRVASALASRLVGISRRRMADLVDAVARVSCVGGLGGSSDGSGRTALAWRTLWLQRHIKISKRWIWYSRLPVYRRDTLRATLGLTARRAWTATRTSRLGDALSWVTGCPSTPSTHTSRRAALQARRRTLAALRARIRRLDTNLYPQVSLAALVGPGGGDFSGICFLWGIECMYT